MSQPHECICRTCMKPMSDDSFTSPFLEAERDRLKAENGKLREALKPLVAGEACNEDADCCFCEEPYTDDDKCEHKEDCPFKIAKDLVTP